MTIAKGDLVVLKRHVKSMKPTDESHYEFEVVKHPDIQQEPNGDGTYTTYVNVKLKLVK